MWLDIVVAKADQSGYASSAAPAAIPQPASRSGTADAGAASDTGKMNASSSAVLAPARTELTTPAKITPNPTTAIATAATTNHETLRHTV